MDIYYCLVILSFLLVKSSIEMNTYELERCINPTDKIACDKSFIITEIKAYAVDTCNTNQRYSNQINISASQFSNCIGVNNCIYSKENNNIKMFWILFNCSTNNSIISIYPGFQPNPSSPVFYTASTNSSVFPLLPSQETIFTCNFSNRSRPNKISIQLSIIILEFLSNKVCDQQLQIYKNTFEKIYASCENYKQDFHFSVTLTNDSFSIQYINQNKSTGKLLIKLEFLPSVMLSVECYQGMSWTDLLTAESISTSSTSVLPFYASTSNIIPNNLASNQPSLSTDAIAGIVVGTTLFLLLIILLACLILYLKETKLKKKTENIAINPVTSAADAADASIGTGETEYKYEPSLAHLEGSDLSGSFQFEKKVMAVPTEDLSGKSKKDKPVLISNYINNDKYSPMQLNDETNRIYTPLSSVTDITNINDTDRGRIESIIMTLENSIYDKNDNSFNFVTSSDIITVEENSLYSETKNDCDKNNNPDLDVSLQPIVTKNKVNINTIDKFNFVTSSDNLTVEENSLYSEIKNDCDITNKPDLNLSLQPIVKNNNININTMDNFIGSSEDLQLEENAIYNKFPDKIPTNDNIIYYELENEVTDLGETNLQQIIPIYEEVEIN